MRKPREIARDERREVPKRTIAVTDLDKVSPKPPRKRWFHYPTDSKEYKRGQRRMERAVDPYAGM